MKIKIVSIHLSHFKGGNTDVEFGDVTDISGQNATGKTRIFDAFTWLFFGKDSSDRKDFEIKDVTPEDGRKPEVRVAAVISIDGILKKFLRVYREKWQKHKGEESQEFTGHETLFYVDGVPMLQNEYKKAVDAVISEEIFKLLTNPFFFSSMGWQDRRKILYSLAPDYNDTHIAGLSAEFTEFFHSLSGKPLDLWRKSIASQKKKLKDDLIEIPARINELNMSKPIVKDRALLEADLQGLQTEYDEVNGKIQSKTKRYETKNREDIERRQTIYKLTIERDRLTNAAGLERAKKLDDLRYRIGLAENNIKNFESDIRYEEENIKAKQRSITRMEEEVEDRRKSWQETDALVPEYSSEGYDCCPTCRQKLPADQLEQKKANFIKFFNEEKAKKLKTITESGEMLSGNIAMEKSNIDKINIRILDKREKINAEEIAISKYKEDIILTETGSDESLNLPAISHLNEEIDSLAKQCEEVKPLDVSDLKKRLDEITVLMDQIKKDLTLDEQIDRINQRYAELLKSEKDLSGQLAQLERLEFVADKFEKTRADLVEGAINAQFAYVQFRLFNPLINGGMEPACEMLINDVPYSSANNAARINAGVDIINTLSRRYGISAPIFVDNAEAVNHIILTESQLVRLIVTNETELNIKSF